jgi:hypothetical protein
MYIALGKYQLNVSKKVKHTMIGLNVHKIQIRKTHHHRRDDYTQAVAVIYIF